jgi:hypothetical protein
MPLWLTYSSEYDRPTGFIRHLESLVWGAVYVQEEYECRNHTDHQESNRIFLEAQVWE